MLSRTDRPAGGSGRKGLIEADARGRGAALEIWVPYGDVEVLITLQAENLGVIMENQTQAGGADHLASGLENDFSTTEKLIVLDDRPATVKLLQALVKRSPSPVSLRAFSNQPKALEQSVPELKGRVARFQDERSRIPGADADVAAPTELLDGSRKLFIGTGAPDPLIGLVDAPAGFAFTIIDGARKLAYASRETDDPAPLARGRPYDALLRIAERLPNSKFVTVFSRKGDPATLVEGPAIDLARPQMLTTVAPPAKAVIISPGGRGYDDTLSQAIRLAWTVVESVRSSGEIVMMAECRYGVGSTALEMVATGRMGLGGHKKASYIEGVEEIAYLNKLKSEYRVTLLSTIPELYSQGRLGFATAMSGGEAVTRVLNSVGRGTKLHVIPRLSETLTMRGQ